MIHYNRHIRAGASTRTTDTRTIRVPESLYRRFERLSALKHQPLDAVIA